MRLQSSPIEDAIRSGAVTFSEPLPRWMGGTQVWEVTITDTTTGETLRKPFVTMAKARGWILDQTVGAQALPHSGKVHSAPRTGRTGCDVLDDDEDDGITPMMPAPITAQATSGDTTKGHGGTKGNRSFKLGAVRDVLAAHGLDPTVEIARILAERRPVLYRKGELAGQPMVDEDTGEVITEYVLDEETRLKTMTALIEYTAPKLKSIEHRIEDAPMTLDQLNTKIALLLSRDEGSARNG